MRVLLVTPSYFPIVGGSETAVRTLSTKLNKIGIHTDILTFNMNRKWDTIWRSEIEYKGLFRVFRIPAIGLQKVFLVNPLDTIQIHVIPNPCFTGRLRNYDIIHFQGEADLSLMLFSYFVRRPKIFTSHINTARFPRLKCLYKLILSHMADLYIAHDMKLLSNYGIPRNRSLAFVSFGVDTDTFKPDETKRIDNLILFVGRIAKIKGLHVLLKSLSSVKCPVQLVIIGPKSGSKYEKICMTLIEEITSKGIHSVHLIGGLNEKNLVPWYQKAAVLVRPDLEGNSGGLTSLEAMSCATTVIGTGNHIVHNGVNGRVVPPDNPEELGKAIDELLADGELRRTYGREGRKMVEEYFSWDKIINKLANIYEVWLSHRIDR